MSTVTTETTYTLKLNELEAQLLSAILMQTIDHSSGAVGALAGEIVAELPEGSTELTYDGCSDMFVEA